MSENKLYYQFIPSLIAILKAAEDNKGTPLTEKEVINIRDTSVCMAVSKDVFLSVEESRGYNDINPENCWNEWCKIREKLKDDEF